MRERDKETEGEREALGFTVGASSTFDFANFNFQEPGRFIAEVIKAISVNAEL